MHLLTGRWQLSATRLALLLALFFTLLNYGFFRTIWQAWRSAGGDGTFLWSVPLFIFLCLNIIFHLLLLPYLHKLIIPLILLLSAAVSYSVIFLGVYFDRAMLTNVLITTPAESAKLLTVPYALWLLALGVVPALLYLRVRVVYRRWWRELALRLGAVLLSLALALLLSHHYYQEYAAYGRNNHDLPHLIVPTNFIVASISKIKHQRRANRPYETVAADAHQQKTDPQRRVSVFIIGEETRAQNWGLNGYARQTTPQLAARGAEVINYPQVSSCGTYTAYSVPCMLSEQPRTRFDVDIASRRDNLLDILQRAGVRVVWYDNDTGCKGACANIEYHDMTALNLSAYCTDGECLDDILLQDIEQPLARRARYRHHPAHHRQPRPDLLPALHPGIPRLCADLRHQTNPAMQPRSHHQHLRQHHPLRGRLHRAGNRAACARKRLEKQRVLRIRPRRIARRKRHLPAQHTLQRRPGRTDAGADDAVALRRLAAGRGG